MYPMLVDEESGAGKEEQDQLDGMKFLGERDMKSLHKVTQKIPDSHRFYRL